MKKFKRYSNTEQKTFTKTKAMCEHCGKKQTAMMMDYSLNYVACKRCGKASLMEIKVS